MGKAKKTVFTGAATAMVTPFTQNGLNLKTLDALIDHQIEGGIDALVMCGTTGEPSTMTAEEEAQVIARALERAKGRVPVIAGAGSNDTAFAVHSAKQAERLGADALLLVTPYYNKTTQEGLIRHYTTIADATALPIILYNVPSRTGLNIAPQTMQRLAEHENIVGIKEASANIEQIVEVARLCPELALYSGNDDHVVPLLALGGKGVISVVSNVVPRLMHEMVQKWLSGDLKGALELQFNVNPLGKALFSEVNPIPVKTALRDMGFDVGPLRLPLIDMQEETHKLLRQRLAELKLI
ncbi:MAG: 4-hydroxy-tetrahydrodipicolinate synthase [Christensenellaceae bacterium]|jgi:4-hydroxy-tetrahydrodipicolinate synthase|nr:4-hydroxy-tetrahydrodipicolinate synthase [Christensenellaceae bacterium]